MRLLLPVRLVIVAALATSGTTIAVPAHAQDRCNVECDDKVRPCVEGIYNMPDEWRRKNAPAATQKCLNEKLECYKKCTGQK